MAIENPPIVFTAASQQRNLVDSFREVWEYRGYIGYLAKRELRTNSLKTYLGWIWSLVEPLMTLAIYSLVFGYILDTTRGAASPTGLENFPAFLFAALVYWGFFRQTANSTMVAFSGSLNLRKKLYFPPAAPSIARVISKTIEMVPEILMLMAFYLLLWGITGIRTVGPTWIIMAPLLVLVCLLGTGVGLWLAVPNSRFGDIGMLFNVFLRLYFYITPIIWPLEIIDGRITNPIIRGIAIWSPLTQVVEAARDGIYRLQWPSLGTWLYLVVISTGTFVTGWIRFHRSAGKAAEGQ